MNGLSSEERYWHIVEDCLVELHGFSRTEAAPLWKELLRRLREHPEPGVEEITYHDEPLYVANDLAGRDLDDPAIDAAYRAIHARYWPELYQDAGVGRPTSRD